MVSPMPRSCRQRLLYQNKPCRHGRSWEFPIERSFLFRDWPSANMLGYREGGKVKTRTLANLSKLPEEAIAFLRQVLKGKQMVSADEAFEIVEDGSRAHGHAEAVLIAMRRLGFSALINSRPSRQRDLVVAMVAARILKPQSKLATTRWWSSTTLTEMLSVGQTDEDELYEAMDWLLEHQAHKGDNFTSEPVTVSVNHRSEPGVTICNIPLTLKNPKLWWTCWELGEQNLYQVDVVVRDGSGFQDKEQESFAIRKLEMAMNPGWTEQEVEYPWTVMLNGKRHYMRSACWGGPPDMFTGRATEGMYREYIRLAKEANINNLRIFCWHPPEIPLFYRLCDEAGITVWQDFSLSHYLYPKNRETEQKIFDECIDVVKQFRNNPSVIILSGGEEILYVKSDDDSDYYLQLITELGRAVPLDSLGPDLSAELAERAESIQASGVDSCARTALWRRLHDVGRLLQQTEIRVCPGIGDHIVPQRGEHQEVHSGG